MIRHAKSIAAAAALALLAACATPPSSPDALPGQTPVSPAFAAATFAQVCVANGGNGAAVRNTLSQGPYLHSTQVNLYYHQQYDLSFGTGQSGSYEECVMRWRGTASAAAYESALDGVYPGARVGYNSEFNVFSVSTQLIN